MRTVDQLRAELRLATVHYAVTRGMDERSLIIKDLCADDDPETKLSLALHEAREADVVSVRAARAKVERLIDDLIDAVREEERS